MNESRFLDIVSLLLLIDLEIHIYPVEDFSLEVT